jgi:D-tyrosyl-tRNA(Tyr) deacylase
MWLLVAGGARTVDGAGAERFDTISSVRAVVQRVTEASVSVGADTIASIGPGMMVLVGVSAHDGVDDAAALASKLAGLRIFADAQGRMNLSAADAGGAVLVVSQFTLLGDVRKGRRPSFTDAAAPSHAEPLVAAVADLLRDSGLEVATGSFGASMAVSLVNDGPVTLVIETRGGRVV